MNTEEAQKLIKLAKVAVIVFILFLGAEALGAFKDLRNIDPAYNSISINGEGEVISIPDIATFSFSVSADGKVVGDAQNQVTKKMDAILAELNSLGIEDNDIKTTDYSIWPKYTYDQGICSPGFCPPSRQVQDGFTVSHTVSVKIRKTEDAGKALAIVGENGATNLSGISFTVDDENGLIDEARGKAIADAQEKAEKLSKELGVRLVRVVSFYDNSGVGAPYYGEGMAADMVKNTSVATPTIPSGENKIKVNVTLIYEIR